MSEFTTVDNRIAAFLAHLNFTHLRTEPAKNRRRGFQFVFADPLNECKVITDNLFAGAGSTDCLSLLDAYRDICATIHYAREEGTWRAKQD
jgi:hypothetical protein